LNVTLRGILVLFAAALALAAEPTPVVFDTDIGNDIDDALALAMLHAFESRGEARLIAVTITKDNRFAAPFVEAVNAFYGRPRIPVGVVRGGKTPEDSPMLRVAGGRKDGAEPPEAVGVLRRALEREKDGSVVVVQVGFSTNLARLLDAAPGLVAAKVRLLSVMAGAFPRGEPEFNVATDIPSARRVFAGWPSPVVFSGFEVGDALLFPGASIERDFAWAPKHPVAQAYRAFMTMPYDRPSWDLTSALYAVRPEAGYFGLSEAGTVTVEEDGRTRFTRSAGGRHRRLIVGDKGRTIEAMRMLASQPR
jgi:inosine-uridine nucleoside N-ribohydrolase